MKVVILAGGTGTRLWPYSRECGPKQILPILGKNTLLQQTYNRLLLEFSKQDILIATGERWQKDILKQLPNFPRQNLLLEPVRRDSAGAIGLTLAHLAKAKSDETIISVHADHWVGSDRDYINTLQQAAQIVQSNPEDTVVVGVKPTYPETGYGYIQSGSKFSGRDLLNTTRKQTSTKVVHKVFRAKQFIEKPALPRAIKFLSSGNYFWNVGMFAWRVDHLWKLYKKYLPNNFAVLEKIAAAPKRSWQKTVRMEFPKLQSISIDNAIAEKTDHMLLLAADIEWADIGHWRSVQEMSSKDSEGNVVSSNSILLDSRDNLFITSPKKLITALGVNNIVVVDTDDAILLVDKNRAQDVKKIVEQLKGKNSWKKYL